MTFMSKHSAIELLGVNRLNYCNIATNSKIQNITYIDKQLELIVLSNEKQIKLY